MKVIKDLERSVKRDVLIADMAMTLYCLYLIIADSAMIWVGFVFGFTPFGSLMLLKASRFYQLCRIHKMMILHTFMVGVCVIYQAEIGFGETLPYFRWSMFLFGVCLWVQLITLQIKRYSIWRKTLLERR